MEGHDRRECLMRVKQFGDIHMTGLDNCIGGGGFWLGVKLVTIPGLVAFGH